MAKLRDYQQRAVWDLWEFFAKNPQANPVMVLPTGSGKSHIIAELCRQMVEGWNSRVLMLTHVQEIIEQNAAKLQNAWPGAPFGIFSAGLGLRQASRPITFAGIQSIHNRAKLLGKIDLVIIDECHRVSVKEEGTYRKLIKELQDLWPDMRVVGLTATPWRLGQGTITDGKDSLFSDLLESVTITELVDRGYLAPLRNKFTDLEFDTSGVQKRGGEFVEKALQERVDTDDQNRAVVQEIIARGQDRQSWLLFCCGVEHSYNMAKLLNDSGIPTGCIVGKTPSDERRQILSDFKTGKLRALTNANVLTTGFDSPKIDLLAMVRPTMSPTLYVQMAGRGMRVHKDKTDCLVLDFAGNVSMHGPITQVVPPARAGSNGEPVTKKCPDCQEIVYAGFRNCPVCSHEFPPPETVEDKRFRLHREIDIMGNDEVLSMPVAGWSVSRHTSKAGNETIRLDYLPMELGFISSVSEYLSWESLGYAKTKAVQIVSQILKNCGVSNEIEGLEFATMDQVIDRLRRLPPPEEVVVKKDGKYFRVLSRRWAQCPAGDLLEKRLFIQGA